MSLLDAFLLEEPSSSVWIALRADACLGSGTEADPFNGSVRFDPPVAVSTITKSGREATASATNTYGNGDVITIAGATGSDAGS